MFHACFTLHEKLHGFFNQLGFWWSKGNCWLCPGVPVHRGNNHCTPFLLEPLFSCWTLLGFLYRFLWTGTRGRNQFVYVNGYPALFTADKFSSAFYSPQAATTNHVPLVRILSSLGTDHSWPFFSWEEGGEGVGQFSGAWLSFSLLSWAWCFLVVNSFSKNYLF